jgi:four helix bundle protein
MMIQDMDAYKVVYQLVLEIYKITKSFPAEEKFGLSLQMKRAAVSIVSNLSEGSARMTLPDKKHFISMARGSAAELQTQISISKDLGFICEGDFKNLNEICDRVRMMLNKLLNSPSAND